MSGSSEAKAKFNINAAMMDLKSGLSMRSVADKYRVKYCNIWQAARRRGISGGVVQRDGRPLDVRIKERMKFLPNGCIIWPGRWITFRRNLRNPTQYARFLFGNFPYGRMRPYRSCSTPCCLNQGHFLGRNAARDEAIKSAWNHYQSAKTTMQRLGDEYGLTKQRIEQIIKRGIPNDR